MQYTANSDGRDYPITGSADSDTISLRKVDTQSAEATQKKAGRVVMIAKREISKDGKTMTVTSKGTSAEGQPIKNVLVFDKR